MGHERMTPVPEHSERARQVTEMMCLYTQNAGMPLTEGWRSLADEIIGKRTGATGIAEFMNYVRPFANLDEFISDEFGRNDWRRVDWEEVVWQLSS